MAFRKTLLFMLVIVLAATHARGQITSTFNSNDDGWTFSDAGTPVTVNFNSTNGNPGGYVSVNYNSNTTVASEGWFAPAKFLGSQVARSYGMNLKFDMQQAFAGSNSSGQGDVIIAGTGGVAIVFSLTVKPAVAPAWSSYTIKLDETAGWRSGNTGGTLATKTDVIRALSNITRLEIRGTYITNAANVSGIDNVILEQKTLPVAPVITSITPVSASPGSNVTINGSSFGSGVAQNSVYFGGVKANVTTANATQVVVKVPAGAQAGPITLINLTTGLVAQSNQLFHPLYDNNKDFGGRIIPASLDLKDDLTLDNASSIEGLALGDLDGDGHVDIVVSEPNLATSTSELSVFKNLGVTGDINATSFAPKVLLGRGTGETAIVDLDGDGKPDILVIDTDFSFTSSFVTYRNISTPGTIAFEAAESWQSPNYSTQGLNIADIDGDGRIDILATHSSSGIGPYFWIHQNLSTAGDIQFGAGVSWDANIFQAALYVSTGDLDGDGKPEIAVVHSFENAFSIFHNTSTPGTISLDPPFLIDPPNTVSEVSIADLDNDGKHDLAWGTSAAAGGIRIRKNIYAGGTLDASSFDPDIILSTPSFAADNITLADINSDGKMDIVASNAINVGVLQNVSTGTLGTNSFLAPVLFEGNAVMQQPRKPVIADLDGDNKPDVVTATTFSIPVQIFIYRNTCFPAPTISNISTSGDIGAALTIVGDHMNTNLDVPSIKFGGIPAIPGATSNTSVATTIPAGAISQRVSVSLHGLTGFSEQVGVTFATSGTIDATSFGTPVEFAMTNLSDGLAIADFDNDGKVDVAVDDNPNMRLLRNTLSSAGATITTGTLTAIATAYTQGTHIVATDVDGDGKIDLVAANVSHRNNSGSTADPISFEANVSNVVGANRIATQDFNHDGKTDFAFTTNGNTYGVVENASRKGAFTSNGGAPFSTIVSAGIGTGAGGQVIGITANDFDGDGYADFAFGANNAADILAVVRNTGLDLPLAPAQFAAAVTFPALDIPFTIASADLDGDGRIDIVVGNNNAAFISVYKNTSTTGSISFEPREDFVAATKAVDIKIADLDGDGKPEVIVAHQPTATTGSFTVFQNTSNTSGIDLSPGVSFPMTRAPLSVEVADMNLDGKPDLIFTGNGATTDALMIFENIISTGPSISIDTQPNSTAVCEGTNASFTVAASGTTNIAYQWQEFDGSVFNNISNGGNYTGTTTATLTIATTGSVGVKSYRCKVSGDGAPDVFSNTATLTVNAIPNAPSTTGDTKCFSASLHLEASGGLAGQYRWYTVQTGGTAIAGQTNGNYDTPVISTTTTYYVSINNGSCESSRSTVIATIAPLPKPSITFDPPIFNAGSTINLCDGDIQKFSAPDAFFVYDWSNGETSQEITIDQSGTYSVVVEDEFGCVSPPSDPIIVVVNPYPIAEITVNGAQLTSTPGDSYQWYNGTAEINGETDQTFMYSVLEFGEYSVNVTDNGCTTSSDVFTYLITAEEPLHGGWRIYPNPFNDNITIEAPTSEGTQITVLDALGRSVREFHGNGNQSLSMSGLQDGQYVMKIQTSKQSFYYRIKKTN